MSESLKFQKSQFNAGRFDEPVFTFIPALLREFPSGWVIEYHVINPQSQLMERKREKFERMRKKFASDDEARKAARKLCKEINKKLSAGWNPYMDTSNMRIYTKLVDALNAFLKEKIRELRPDTKRVYTSHIGMFIQWLSDNKLGNLLVQAFTAAHADDYLTYKYVEQGTSSYTYNNYLVFFRGLFNWMVDKGYCSTNPFRKLRKKKTEEKTRKVIPTEWDKRIMDYCVANNPRLAFICMLVYSSFLRPAEICRIKVKDIHLDKSAIFISGENAKNKHSRWAILTSDTIRMIEDMHILDVNPDWYVISTGLLPGPKKKETRDIDKHWHRMRIDLNMPKEFQLYSLRDTGIMYLKDQGVPDHMIVKLTGHLKMDMLEKYTHDPQQEALRLSAQFLPKLGDRVRIDHSKPSAYSDK